MKTMQFPGKNRGAVLLGTYWLLAGAASDALDRVYSELPPLNSEGAMAIRLADGRTHHVAHQDACVTYYHPDGQTPDYTEFPTGETVYFGSDGKVRSRETEAGARNPAVEGSPGETSSGGSDGVRSSGGQNTAEAGLFNQGLTRSNQSGQDGSPTLNPGFIRGEIHPLDPTTIRPSGQSATLDRHGRLITEAKDEYRGLRSSVRGGVDGMASGRSAQGPPSKPQGYQTGQPYYYPDGKLLCKENAACRAFYARDGRLWWEEMFDGTGQWRHYRKDGSLWFVGDKAGNRTYYHADGSPWYRRDAHGKKRLLR